MTRVSVLIPAYNAAAYVSAAVESVLAQTLTEWEIVAVDDASSDDTAAILESWAARDRRIRALRNEANLGMTGNWNRCLAAARGELIVKLDADDVLRPRALEVLTEAMSGGAIAAGARALLCDASLEPFGVMPGECAMLRAGIDPHSDHDLPTERWYAVAAHGEQLWSSCGVMFRRDRITTGWDDRFGCASDTEIIWRMLEQPGIFAHRAYVAVYYRVLSQSVSGVFRANDWLTWEGVAGNLLTLDRYRRRRPLPRALRLRYAYLWSRWHDNLEANASRIPPAIWARLSSVVAGVDPPPLAERALWRMRKVVAG